MEWKRQHFILASFLIGYLGSWGAWCLSVAIHDGLGYEGFRPAVIELIPHYYTVIGISGLAAIAAGLWLLKLMVEADNRQPDPSTRVDA